MNEFDLIQTYLAGLAGPEGLGLLDDAAIWSPPKGCDAVISADTLVEGVHFPKGKFDSELAQKLIRCNISDIVAKGADPIGYFLSLSMNEDVSETDIASFCQGLAADQQEYGLKLWGGDTTKTSGPNVLSITILGTVPTGKMVRRSGAQPGDILCVTGTIGDGYLGLKVLIYQMDADVSDEGWTYLRQAYHVPMPPFALRYEIRSYANAAMDISDGLIADARHLAKASQQSLIVNLQDIPTSTVGRNWVDQQSDQQAAFISLATGGDDYQALMTVSPDKFDELYKKSKACGVNLTKIGHVETGEGVDVRGANDDKIDIEKPGFVHF